ncbi:hypothetical protein Dda_1776 [Drechslerella dactyloides]|uniref:Uncharacterized protein n=1 Tax=Drechslerella dactyloides TaxID=74499 RepID=A0AAD6NME8_DREDA|nr:hypothetical protein Dda_1776 [Drechslerella dactyloides]
MCYNRMRFNSIFALLVVGFFTFSTGQPTTIAAAAATASPDNPTPQAGAFQPLPPATVLQTFYWFHTNSLGPNTPVPTLRGRIFTVDHLGFTKYRVTCLPQDAPAGCTYKDFTVTASGTSQMYYETRGAKKSVGCSLHSTSLAVCSSRNHGEDVSNAITKTWHAEDFPGYYPVLITAEPTATPWDWDYFYSHATADTVFTPAIAGGGLGLMQTLSREMLALTQTTINGPPKMSSEVDVQRKHLKERLPHILKLIQDAEFISFDFEYSGIVNDSNRGAFPGKVERSRKPTLEERYQISKESAQKYCVLQMGLCFVAWDHTMHKYIAKTFNFYMSPIVHPHLHYDRIFCCTADAMHFHQKHGFDFNKLYSQGVPYLSHSEEAYIRELKRMNEADLENDIFVDPCEQPILQVARDTIDSWWKENSRDPGAFLNLTPSHQDEVFNGYQRRLIHQMLRKEYPHLVGQSYDRHFQVQPRVEAREMDRAKAREQHFETILDEQRGVRLLIDEIMRLKKPIVGHNCFGDLCYLYRMFIGELPDTLDDFRRLLRKEFGLIVDTKFLALNVDHYLYSEMSSCLQELSVKFGYQELPKIGKLSPIQTQEHEAGSTARALVKLAFRMYNAGSDTPLMPSESTSELDKRKQEIEEALAARPPRAGLAKMVEFEKTPALARIPSWSSKFWTVFGGRLRVNGTIEGEFTI